MMFDVTVTHELACCRVVLRGQGALGRLLSLLQVLEIDSAGWTAGAVLIDLRQLHPPLSVDEHARLAQDAARALRRMRKIAFVAAPGGLRDAAGTRTFDDEDAALRWIVAA